MHEIKLGFIPLVDCALLAIAKEKGFAEENGIQLSLHKEVSWANIRDKIYLGYLDGAQMLAGMPIAANLGLMPNSCEIVAPFVLGRNGNAITVSRSLFAEMQKSNDTILEELDLKKTGAALKAVIDQRKIEGKTILRFGMVFPFSCHNYHLRYWMSSCGIEPDIDVHLEVIPPPFMDQYLEEGRIDGFCVGEPWNSLAVEQDVGVIIATTKQVWAYSPEKMLGLRKQWVDTYPEALNALMKTLHQCVNWAMQSSNIDELSKLLSSHTYIDVPAEIIKRALTGDIKLKNAQDSTQIENFLMLNANKPEQAAAKWLFDQMVRWKQAENIDIHPDALKNAFATQVYSEHLPSIQYDIEIDYSLFDGKIIKGA